MKTLLVIAAAVLLTGCATMMPAWFQRAMIVSRDDPGTKIYCDAVNQTDPYIMLEAVFVNDVNIGAELGDERPLNYGDKYSFQIGYGMWQNSAQHVRGRARTGGGYSEMAIDANVYALGRLADGTPVMVYPMWGSRQGNMRLTSARNNTLIFERYKIARPTPSQNPHTTKRR